MKKKLSNFIRTTQKIIITILLFIIYIVGIGITKIFVMVFKREILTRRYRKKDSFWIEAEGYAANINDSLRQS
jgi:hypothetical protein